MRRVVLSFLTLLLFVLSVAPVSAITYQEGVRTAKSENKPLYLYFYTDS